MLKDHRTTRLRNFGGAAALVVLAGATLSLSSPGAAHPHPDGQAETKQQRIVIMEHRDGAGAAHGRDVMIRRGPNGEIQVPEGCTSSTPTADVSEGEGNRRTRVLICSREGASPADMAANLERARDRIAQNDELSAETKARIREQLDREIARLRAR